MSDEKGVTAEGELKMLEDKYQQKVDALRREMGTLPDLGVIAKTEYHAGVEGISVERIDGPRNPYRTILEVAVATWGNEAYPAKWSRITPENRFKVVKAALSGQTLPQAVEPVGWSFIVRGASRSAFDQHARQRLATFFSQGVRDNSRADSGFRVPSELHPKYGGDPELYKEIQEHVESYKKLYVKILKTGWGSFQTARSIFPMGSTHNYRFYANLGAIKSYLSQRLQFCEQEDTVAVAVAVWKNIHDQFPLIADHLRPGCDYAKRCTYHQASTLSELFSALFAGCGRWEDPVKYATFNKSCSDSKKMKEQLGYMYPEPTEWKNYSSFKDLEESDKKLFTEDCVVVFDPVTGE